MANYNNNDWQNRNNQQHNQERVDLKHNEDRNRYEREARVARENAEAMKQTLTWLIPLLLLLAIGYYLYRRAYMTTDVTPVKPVVTTQAENAARTVAQTASAVENTANKVAETAERAADSIK